MQFANYESLKSAIADELNRDDLSGVVDGFISLCEAQTERQLRTREMLTMVPDFLISGEYQALPAGFLEVRSFAINSNPPAPLSFRTIDSIAALKQAFPQPGRPSDYSVVGEQFYFVKSPDTAYTAMLLYYQQIPRLSDSVPTNWLLQKHPDIYFYGALLNSAPYLKEDPRIAVWARFYQGAVDSLSMADDRSQTASNGLTSRARMF